ncbi:sulfatase family protein [Echinicola shivajiensis]|uniref:sulfatase family protein n=1 Tax=Echinicola shivajiensis TaxID=1035916 RepID=UPI001BFC0790|nr:sulfatase [Echinicola shivajiensis]
MKNTNKLILSIGGSLLFLFFSIVATNAKDPDRKKAERPNILFLVVEDTSPYLFPAYGNTSISTPNIDFLAENGVTFDNAFSNAPYCSPARSSLISGSYATTYGTDYHRNSMVVPQEYFFPQYLKNAGYYTVNAGKTDYNITRAVQKVNYPKTWDGLSGYRSDDGSQANESYNNPERGNRPFFGQFNNHTTHMSRMTSVTVDVRAPVKLDMNNLLLPPHLPDLPEVRADYALHLEGVQDTDKWVGAFLDDLREKDLLENTLIFFFSDHGGCLPRGKAFPFESGMKPALIVYAPEKWQHLLPAQVGSHSGQIVEFSDFGPTLLSIVGEEIPGHMQGKPFMGEFAQKRKYAHAFRTNTEDHFDPSRVVADEQYFYIKNYTPYKRHGIKQSFQWGMPAQQAWDDFYYQGKASFPFRSYYEVKPKEYLFDMKTDPYGLNNLAHDPSYQEKLQELRQEASSHIRRSGDLGFFPRDVRDEFTKEGISLYEWIRESKYDLASLHELVERASSPQSGDEEYFMGLLKSERPEVRWWALSGLAYMNLTEPNKEVGKAIYSQIISEPYESVRAIAAEAIVYSGYEQGLEMMMADVSEGNIFAASSLENIGELAKPKLEEVKELAISAKSGRIRFQMRSVLIDFGLMDMDQLFEKNQISGFVKGHKHRVAHPIPTLP